MMKQPDDPVTQALSEFYADEDRAALDAKRYKTRWTVYHSLLVIGVWGIWVCALYALKYGWGSL
jgi:hypothetical protein